MPLDPNTGIYQYNIGDLLRLKTTFTSLTGTLVDPTSIQLKVKAPSGTVTTYTYPSTVTKESAGVYYHDFAVTESGTHYYNWQGSGAFTAADESSFEVVSTQF